MFPFKCLVPNKGTTGTISRHFWYDTVLVWGLNPGPPALEASTIPLGYLGGGHVYLKVRKSRITLPTVYLLSQICTLKSPDTPELS